MWCQSCRQDVPGLVDDLDGRFGCPRCGTVLLNDAGIDLTADLEQLRSTKPASDAVASSPYSADDAYQPDFEPVRKPETRPSRITSLRWDAANWELNEKLRHVERVTTVSRRRFDAAPPTAVTPPHAPTFPQPSAPIAGAYPVAAQFVPFPNMPWPGAYAAPPHPTNPYATPPYEPVAPQPPPQQYEMNVAVGGVAHLVASLTSWLFLGGAVTAFSCGAFLAAWGGLNDRPNVQQLGMPVVLLGLISLVIGLLPQIFLRRLEEHATREFSAGSAAGSPGSAKPHQISRAPSSAGRFAGR
jgi:hypothetical protein